MYDSPYAAVNEITIHGYPIIKEPEQIVITSDMVIDLVDGGSVYSPQFLFDEQGLDISANEHAISNPWKPFYTDANSPYYTMLDLGQEYHITEISLHDMNAIFDFVVEYGDNNIWTELFVEPCDAFKVWKTHQTDITTRYLRLKMPQSPYAAVNEVIITGMSISSLPGTTVVPIDAEPEEQQIIITSGMVTDLVSGGSVYSSQFLFDEQGINPISNEHPVSQPWKPYYTNANAPYYTSIDLGQEYHISKVYLHDINAVFDFNVEYDNNSNWNTLFVESCDAFKVWKMHETDVNTRYLRLGMLDSPYAAVNEMILYGYPISNSSKQVKNKKNVAIKQFNKIDKIELYPNPVSEKIYLKFPEQMVGSNRIQVSDILGKVFYTDNIKITSESPTFELSTNSYLSASGFYVFSCISELGEQQTIKFFKQ